jgi:hypothetical protein
MANLKVFMPFLRNAFSAQTKSSSNRSGMNPLARVEDIQADIAKAERLMTALRLKVAVKRSVREDTTTDDRRRLKMMQGWMLQQDQRQRALEADLDRAAASKSRASFLSPLL